MSSSTNYFDCGQGTSLRLTPTRWPVKLVFGSLFQLFCYSGSCYVSSLGLLTLSVVQDTRPHHLASGLCLERLQVFQRKQEQVQKARTASSVVLGKICVDQRHEGGSPRKGGLEYQLHYIPYHMFATYLCFEKYPGPDAPQGIELQV